MDKNKNKKTGLIVGLIMASSFMALIIVSLIKMIKGKSHQLTKTIDLLDKETAYNEKLLNKLYSPEAKGEADDEEWLN